MRVGRGARWRAQLVAVGTFVTMALTALGLYGIVARATGWEPIAMEVLFGCAAGLLLLDPRRTRRITRPTLRVVGAIALTLLTISGTFALVDAVTTIA
ncbi:MAG TPA: hypothetical protein VJZ98_02040 [Actinomycetota bacterium]|nr:hypothetical protein [Actinomycetota bacterium]